MNAGNKVIFVSKVYKAPYSPYYDKYVDQVFEIVAFHYEDTHVELKCVSDPSIKVDGYVHHDELMLHSED